MTIADRLIKRGVEQGMQQGVQQGVQQGEQRARVEMARIMLEKGHEIKNVAEITGVSITELELIISSATVV